MTINRAEAERFLKALDTKTDKFTFQTFDDNEKRKDKALVRILHGTLAQRWDKLVDLSKRGAGIYITVNATDLKGRKAENVTGIRAVCVDLDGAPLEPAKTPRPHIIVESSPKRWHVYWKVTGFPIDGDIYREAQKKLIKRLNSDKKITDLPRVLRLPGFPHQKGKPFKTRIVDIWNGKPYKASVFINGSKEPTKKKKLRISTREPVNIKQLTDALEVLPSDDYQIWFEVGCALYTELGDDAGFPIFDRWSRKSEKYDKRQCERKWEECCKTTKFSAGTIFHYATETDPTWRAMDAIPEGATTDDFVSFLPAHRYVYTPTGQLWPAESVNARLPKQQMGDKRVAASTWLDRFRKAEGMTWSPGDPEMIPDRVARSEGGWIEKPGTMCLNTYRPPMPSSGDPSRAMRWVDHVHKLYPDDAEHMLCWFASRVQHPGTKINHGLVIGGEQGIGKDMIMKPVRHAVGTWNCVSVAPKVIMGSFNSYVKSVICQIDEARDLGDTKHYDFYEHLKTLTTAPPDLLQCNEKHINTYAVANVTGVILTTNHRTGSIYLPPGDRRFYVAWSTRTKEEFTASYFNDLQSFYDNDGYAHIAAYLMKYNIKKFNPKAPPPQTEAFHDIVEANLPMEDAEFAETLNLMDRPPAITIAQIIKVTPNNSFANWLDDRRNARSFAHRLESCGYVAVRDPGSGHNRWRFRVSRDGGIGILREVAIYALKTLGNPARVKAANELVRKLQRDNPD